MGGMVDAPQERLVQHCAMVWHDRNALEIFLLEQVQILSSCK
jgi:hypothetical protein